jgi:acyl-CoA thioesterase
MTTLRELATPRPDGDHYALDVPAGWRQGRGAFGGLVVGALVRAIEDHVGDPARAVRAVTAELPGPVAAGPAAIAVHALRTGKHVSTVRAELTQAGEVCAHAVAILGAARAAGTAPAWVDLAPPRALAWAELPVTAIDAGRGGPEFAQHFEYRIVEGVPQAGGAGRALGWIRPRVPGPAFDAAYLAALIDAWWPCALIRLPVMRPMATIAFTLEVIGPGPADPAAPLLYAARSPVCTDGYARETRELWTADGQLVATNHQTFAIIA